jgi:hypothetical protein
MAYRTRKCASRRKATRRTRRGGTNMTPGNYPSVYGGGRTRRGGNNTGMTTPLKIY